MIAFGKIWEVYSELKWLHDHWALGVKYPFCQMRAICPNSYPSGGHWDDSIFGKTWIAIIGINGTAFKMYGIDVMQVLCFVIKY